MVRSLKAGVDDGFYHHLHSLDVVYDRVRNVWGTVDMQDVRIQYIRMMGTGCIVPLKRSTLTKKSDLLKLIHAPFLLMDKFTKL